MGYPDFTECGDGVGPALISGDTLKSSILQLTSTLHDRDRQNEDKKSSSTGRSAGDAFSNWSIWASYNNADFDSDLPLVNAFDGNGNPILSAHYSSESDGFTLGTDSLVYSNVLAGLAVTYQKSDTFTSYNAGNNESTSFTISPYAAYLINDTFSIDIAAGYSSLDNKTDRIDNSNGAVIYGKFDSNRLFVASNLSAISSYQNWFFSGRVGFMHMKEKQDAYTESTAPSSRSIQNREITLSQIITSVDAAYSFNSFEPYAIASYIYDTHRDEDAGAGGLPGNVTTTRADNDEIQYGLGIRYFANELSGSFEWSKTVGRANFSGNVWMITLRTAL